MSAREEAEKTPGPIRLTGVAAAEGAAVGPVFAHIPGELKPRREHIPEAEAEAEMERFRRAVEVVAGRLSEMSERLVESGSGEEAAIFEAHAEMAGDPELESGVEERVRNLQSPEAALLAVGEEYAEIFAAMEDEYMAARADDVRDVTGQIAVELMGREAAGDPAMIPKLVELGVTELSMGAPAIPRAKKILSEL